MQRFLQGKGQDNQTMLMEESLTVYQNLTQFLRLFYNPSRLVQIIVIRNSRVVPDSLVKFT